MTAPLHGGKYFKCHICTNSNSWMNYGQIMEHSLKHLDSPEHIANYTCKKCPNAFFFTAQCASQHCRRHTDVKDDEVIEGTKPKHFMDSAVQNTFLTSLKFLELASFGLLNGCANFPRLGKKESHDKAEQCDFRLSAIPKKVQTETIQTRNHYTNCHMERAETTDEVTQTEDSGEYGSSPEEKFSSKPLESKRTSIIQSPDADFMIGTRIPFGDVSQKADPVVQKTAPAALADLELPPPIPLEIIGYGLVSDPRLKPCNSRRGYNEPFDLELLPNWNGDVVAAPVPRPARVVETAPSAAEHLLSAPQRFPKLLLDKTVIDEARMSLSAIEQRKEEARESLQAIEEEKSAQQRDRNFQTCLNDLQQLHEKREVSPSSTDHEEPVAEDRRLFEEDLRMAKIREETERAEAAARIQAEQEQAIDEQKREEEKASKLRELRKRQQSESRMSKNMQQLLRSKKRRDDEDDNNLSPSLRGSPIAVKAPPPPPPNDLDYGQAYYVPQMMSNTGENFDSWAQYYGADAQYAAAYYYNNVQSHAAEHVDGYDAPSAAPLPENASLDGPSTSSTSNDNHIKLDMPMDVPADINTEQPENIPEESDESTHLEEEPMDVEDTVESHEDTSSTQQSDVGEMEIDNDSSEAITTGIVESAPVMPSDPVGTPPSVDHSSEFDVDVAPSPPLSISPSGDSDNLDDPQNENIVGSSDPPDGAQLDISKISDTSIEVITLSDSD